VKRLVIVLGVAACATEYAPVNVRTSLRSPAEVARALDAADAAVDGNTITTRWLDTGYAYGFVGGHRANVYRRYIAVLDGDQVTLRAEIQRCARGSWDDLASVGACELLQGLLPRDRAALVELSQKLR
jgi:hypothetical protein